MRLFLLLTSTYVIHPQQPYTDKGHPEARVIALFWEGAPGDGHTRRLASEMKHLRRYRTSRDLYQLGQETTQVDSREQTSHAALLGKLRRLDPVAGIDEYYLVDVPHSTASK